jgi:hypothetical protein
MEHDPSSQKTHVGDVTMKRFFPYCDQGGADAYIGESEEPAKRGSLFLPAVDNSLRG